MDETQSNLIGRSFAVRSALIFLITTLLFFSSLLLAGSKRLIGSAGGDMREYYLPMRAFGFGEMAKGHVPQWNPYTFSGTPYAANFQAALWYPPNWLHLVMNPVAAINWIVVLHLALGGWLASLWGRLRGLDAIPSVFGGLVFEFSSGFFMHTAQGHLTVLCAIPWLALLLLALEGLLRDPRQFRWIFWGAMAVAMPLLAGHPQTTYYSLLAAGLFVLVRCFGNEKWKAVLPRAALAVVVGLLLSAAQLWPGMKLAGESVRQSGVSYKFSVFNALPPENLLTVFTPSLFGRSVNDYYFGPTFRFPNQPAIKPFYFGRGIGTETSIYVGAIAMGLVIYALAAPSRRRVLRDVGPLALVFMVLALGHFTPLHKILFTILPGYDRFRGTAWFGFVADLFLAMAAAEGLGALRRDARPIPAAAIIAGLGALFVVLGVWLQYDASNAPNSGVWSSFVGKWNPARLGRGVDVTTQNTLLAEWGRYTATQLIVVAALLLVTASGVALSRRYDPGAAWTLGALAVVEIFLSSSFVLFHQPPASPLPPAWASAAKLRYDERALFTQLSSHGLEYRIEDAYGYDPIVLMRYAQFLAAGQHVAYDHLDWVPPITRIAEGFGLLRVNNIFYLRNGEAIVNQLQSAMPRIQLVSGWALKGPDDALKTAAADANFDPREVVLLESEPNPKPVATKSPGSVRLTSMTPDELRIEVEVSTPAILLISDVYSPGWEAAPISSGGPQAIYEVMRADYILRGIPLAAGKHEIRVSYRAPGLIAGVATSIVTFLGLLGAAVAFGRRSRQIRTVSRPTPSFS